MPKLPKDREQRVIGSTARGLVHYKFPKEHWEYHEMTGADCGIDCLVELIEDEEYHNKKIEGQIKGTRSPNTISNGEFFSFPMELKTIRYGLGSSSAFVLFYVDNINEIVYYLPIQDYFISNPKLFDKLDTKQKTMNVHIPADNIISEDDYELQQIAKSVYVEGPSRSLHKAM